MPNSGAKRLTNSSNSGAIAGFHLSSNKGMPCSGQCEIAHIWCYHREKPLSSNFLIIPLKLSGLN
jgi:hypothetical protein